MVLNTTKTPNDLPQKTPNDLPQKHQTICHKNTKRNAAKTPNEMRNPQEISVLCLVFNV